MTKQKKLVLERINDNIEITMELWAEALLLAQKYGWVSNKPSYFYLACNEPLADEEARAIHGGLENLFQKALENPLEVYPIRVDMAQLYLLKEFLQHGEFTFQTDNL